MKTDTGRRIVEFIEKNQKARVYDLVRQFKISPVAIHKQLRKLVGQDQLKKIGKPPLVFYVKSRKEPFFLPKIAKEQFKKNNQSYLYISPSGEIIEGFLGFSRWAVDTKQEKYLERLAAEYIKTREMANKFINTSGWIDAVNKLKQTFKKIYVEGVFFQDFYSLPKFGKTKLGQLMLYAKQSQKRSLMEEIIKMTKPFVKKLIKKFKIEAVVFIPPTIPRQIQFMKELRYGLRISLPTLDLVKVYAGDIPVAQKTLSRLEQRIINARETIQLKERFKAYKKVLLIDDAVGSGATFNETAKKLKEEKIAKKVYAAAIVGSFKGFDVIREV
jgi:hypothetical protein